MGYGVTDEGRGMVGGPLSKMIEVVDIWLYFFLFLSCSWDFSNLDVAYLFADPRIKPKPMATSPTTTTKL